MYKCLYLSHLREVVVHIKQTTYVDMYVRVYEYKYSYKQL